MPTEPNVPTLCPFGRPQTVALFIERGWSDNAGRAWVSCPCGMAHIRPNPFLMARRHD